jgi:glucose-1-phosphate thymidylyltransferase
VGNQETRGQEEVIGLIPAAGFARRIPSISCSKEVYPVNYHYFSDKEQVEQRAVSSYLLESMETAGIEQGYMIIRDGKWDIPAHLSRQDWLKLDLAYLVVGANAGVPYTIDSAYPFIKNKKIVLGFPDIMFEPKDAFTKLLKKLDEAHSDAVLGLFEADYPRQMDMVEVDERNKIQRIISKPQKTDLVYTWILAAWNASFTEYLHHFLLTQTNEINKTNSEIQLGKIIQKAIKEGLEVSSVNFRECVCLDIGTPEGLKRAKNITVQ